MVLSRFLRIKLTRAIMRVFWLFPIDEKKVFFSAYEGKQYSCNPRAIYEKMRKESDYSDFHFVWELNDEKNRPLVKGDRVSFVTHSSLGYMFAVMTSKYIITNSGISGRFPLRKGQMNMNTWHGGGAFKRVGHGVKTDLAGDLYELDARTAHTTHFLTSSSIFTEVMHSSIGLPMDRFFPTGMPRNDIFFDNDASAVAKDRVRRRYGIDEGHIIVLYAPTYRGNVGEDKTDGIPFGVSRLKETLKKRFGKNASLLVRMHYFNSKSLPDDNIIPASDYPDMQELLAAADVLITDYSSSIWDFSLTGRLCLLYTPDLEDYDGERGFYTQPDSWPGILCADEEQLNEAVQSFDESKYKDKVRAYLSSSGSYDTGNAAEKTLSILSEFGKV